MIWVAVSRSRWGHALALSMLSVPAASAAQTATVLTARPEGPPSIIFVVRADLSLDRLISPVLAEVGQPILYPVEDGETPTNALIRICGSQGPEILSVVSRTGTSKTTRYVRAAPCLRRARNVTVLARDGDTRESIAVRLGMRRDSASELRIVRSGEPWRGSSGGRLAPGDRVIAPEAPEWVSFVAKDSAITSREQLVERIAVAMGCGAESSENCLARRSVTVTSRKPAAKMQGRFGGGQPVGNDGPVDPTASAVPADPPAIPPDQWPYDAKIVRSIIERALAQGQLRRSQVGIIDYGLADSTGKPFGVTDFGEAGEMPPVDSDDNDLNGIVDDIYGAGPVREVTGSGLSGDVGLCDASQPPDYATWSANSFELASHGAITASIATGVPLRTEAIAAALPKMLFFRLARRLCQAEPDYSPEEYVAIDAVGYLFRYDLAAVNMSFDLLPGDSRNLVQNLKDLLIAPNAPMIVTAAGNEGVDIDQNPVCPPCLGDALTYSMNTRERLLVVGAAEKSLRPAGYSNFGNRSVRLYAPAEPTGALDILAGDAGRFASATSYAAPLVTFAIAMARSLGMTDQSRIRNRLLLAGWPLLNSAGEPVGKAGGQLPVAVLNLAQFLAVRQFAIEVVEKDANGVMVRRTLVGEFPSGLAQLCTNIPFNPRALSAIFLSEPDSSGLRQATQYFWSLDPNTRFPSSAEPAACLVGGDIPFRPIGGAEVTIPARTVTKVLMPERLQ